LATTLMTNDLEPRANAQNAAFALRAVAPFACYHVHLIVTMNSTLRLP
jgi:hypothetical protein